MAEGYPPAVTSTLKDDAGERTGSARHLETETSLPASPHAVASELDAPGIHSAVIESHASHHPYFSPVFDACVLPTTCICALNVMLQIFARAAKGDPIRLSFAFSWANTASFLSRVARASSLRTTQPLLSASRSCPVPPPAPRLTTAPATPNVRRLLVLRTRSSPSPSAEPVQPLESTSKHFSQRAFVSLYRCLEAGAAARLARDTRNHGRGLVLALSLLSPASPSALFSEASPITRSRPPPTAPCALPGLTAEQEDPRPGGHERGARRCEPFGIARGVLGRRFWGRGGGGGLERNRRSELRSFCVGIELVFRYSFASIPSLLLIEDVGRTRVACLSLVVAAAAAASKLRSCREDLLGLRRRISFPSLSPLAQANPVPPHLPASLQHSTSSPEHTTPTTAAASRPSSSCS